MNAGRVAAVIVKEVRELLRDRITVAICLVMPVVMLVLFGYSITLDVEAVRYGVLDLDRSPASRTLIARFDASRTFAAGRALASGADLDAAMQTGAIKLGLVIPPGFARRSAGAGAEVQLVADGTHSATAMLAIGHASAIVRRFPTPARHAIQPRTRVWFNPSLRSFNYIVPGLYAVILMALPPLLTALAIVREKERGSIQQIYASSLTAAEFVAGKLLPYAGLAFLQFVIVVLVGSLWFRVPFHGSPALLLFAAALYVLTTVGVGLLVSAVTRSQLAAMLLALILTMMPSFLYSGFLFPLFTMPMALQLLCRLFPAGYFMEISRGVVLKGAGLAELWPNLALLGAYTVLVFAFAAWRLRMKVA